MTTSRCIVLFAIFFTAPLVAQDTVREGSSERSSTAKTLMGESVWAGHAPRETSDATGEEQPPRPSEQPPVSRVTKIRRPTLDVFLPRNPSGVGMLILPGGGFGKVVPNKEGSEAAPWLNAHGIAVFVLRYRTNEVTPKDEPAWRRPLQDAQRALRLIRSREEQWSVDPRKIGVLGFSAGGQVASILTTRHGRADYEPMDSLDKLSCAPDFSLLIYPWRVLDAKGKLLADIQVGKETPPTFLVHTHDDASSALGSVQIYADLKRHGVDGELHVFRNGGHGYGMRAVEGSAIGEWPTHATAWLRSRGLTRELNP